MTTTSLNTFISTDPTSTNVFNTLVSEMETSGVKEVSVPRIMEVLGMQDTDRNKVVRVLKALPEFGAGEFIIGRRGGISRFRLMPSVSVEAMRAVASGTGDMTASAEVATTTTKPAGEKGKPGRKPRQMREIKVIYRDGVAPITFKVVADATEAEYGKIQAAITAAMTAVEANDNDSAEDDEDPGLATEVSA